MKRLWILLALACVSLNGMMAQTVAEWPEIKREAKAGLRWWWLGSAVDKENLRWNMEQYAKAGVGTLEITPIYGVQGNATKNIQFLSTDWLEMLKYTKQVGEELDIDIDMTTGTGWPFGGPMVKKEESASKLVTESFDVTGDGTAEKTLTLNTGNGALQCVMAFPQKGNDEEVVNLVELLSEKTLKWVAPIGTWKVIAAYNQYGAMQVKRPSPGSSGYVVDYFDKTAVANYLNYFDTKFAAGGNPWPHSFFNDSYEINVADWTPQLLTEFEQRRGYSLAEYMDLLLGVGNRDTASKTKAQVVADYRQTLADMLLENFTRQWTQWAHSHGVTTRNQAHGSPGNLIDLYAEADIPEIENFYMNSFGIKGLRDDAGFYLSALSTKPTLKYASSAAHITGKPLVSSESMTWLTEHFRTSLSQIKPELDQLFLSGVNHVLFHGAAYSPREAAWPGWKFYAAVDMSPTNSIWRDAPAMMDYIKRVQSFMQMGQPNNDVLVYAPFANDMTKDTSNKLRLYNINTLSSKMSELETCVNNLERMGLDCDYTSERYLMTTTFVNGKLQTAAGTCYQALVIPVSTNLPDSVKTHIEGLAAQGAQVIYGNKQADLEALTIKPEPLRTELGLGVIRRTNASGHHYFISNLTSNDVEGYVALAVPFTSVAVFDPLTGEIGKGTVAEGKVWISLKSGQSVILQTYQTDVTMKESQQPVTEIGSVSIDGPWTLSFTEDSEPAMTEKNYQLERTRTWETLDAETARLMGTGIYETTFNVTAAQMQTASAGFRLNLGDVRESARVWLNGEYLGCTWAVPYVVDCKGLVHEGENTLKIEVTNLPANRIRQMDIDKVNWRIFEDANISTISSSNTYDNWKLVPSGLNSHVQLVMLSKEEKTMKVELKGMAKDDNGICYAMYKVMLPGGKKVESLSMSDQKGAAFDGFRLKKNDDGTAELIITGKLSESAIVDAMDDKEMHYYAYVAAHGAYEQTIAVDFTSSTPPEGGWISPASTMTIKGFEATGVLPWHRANKNGKEVTGLYEGLTFTCDRSAYYFYFEGYGMNAGYDFNIIVNKAKHGDVCLVSYLKGKGDSEYHATDSLLMYCSYEDSTQTFMVPMYANTSYYIYRSLAVYSPIDVASSIQTVGAEWPSNHGYFNLKGQRVMRPGKGIYVKNGRKIVLK